MQSRLPQLLLLGVCQSLIDSVFAQKGAVAVGHEELVTLGSTDGLDNELGIFVNDKAHMLLIQIQEVAVACASDVGELLELADVVGSRQVEGQSLAVLVPAGVRVFEENYNQGLFADDEGDFPIFRLVHTIVLLLTVQKKFA